MLKRNLPIHIHIIVFPVVTNTNITLYFWRHRKGTSIKHAIGSAEVYGLVEPIDPNKIPIALLENETHLKTSLTKDQALTFENIDLPDCTLTTLWHRQQGS